MKKTHKRISAAVLSLALGFSVAGAPALAPMAGAQAASVFDIPAGAVSTINPGIDASLTIEKYEGFPIAGPGEYRDSVGLPGLEAQFTVQQVMNPDNSSIDLTTQDGWAQVNDLMTAAADENTTAEQAIFDEGLTLETEGASQTTTEANGYIITFDLPVGVYLVTETTPEGFQASAPFFVTLPSVYSDDSGWNYEVTVQPKNQADTRVVKTVEDELAALGTVSNYTIQLPIPDQADLSSIQVLDNLPDELNLVGELGEFGNVNVSVANGTETISFENNSNLNALILEIIDGPSLDALRGETLVVTFDAVIVAGPGEEEAPGGVIENSASIDLEIGEVTYTYTTDPDEPTETRLGTLEITKLNVDGDEISVGTDATAAEREAATAEFELWRCTAQGDAPDVQWVLGAGPLETLVNEVPTTTFETDPSTGTAIIEDIQMANFVNGEETLANDTLCVVETKAPTGYVLNPEPQPVTVGDNFTMTADVINLDDEVTSQLPSTGGMGTMAMIAGGLLVAVAGGFAALRGNRARR